MSENLIIPTEAGELERYEYCLNTCKAVLSPAEPLVSNLSNLTAIVKEVFPKISWAGFYLYNGINLYLGPFQGKLACTQIAIGKGVCGTAAELRQTVIVKNVHEFPGHIACDSGSNSEIVVPLIKSGNLLGVLDLDSYLFEAFSDLDKEFLEKILYFLTENVISEQDPLVAHLFQ